MREIVVAGMTVLVVALALAVALPAAEGVAEEEARRIVSEFQAGLAAHDIERIEPLVAADLVAFENGHRNDGWADFRDNHLKPEFEADAPPQEWELVRVKASAEMAWAYTRTDLHVTRSSGEKLELLLWSVYVLEKRGGEWKIVMLDWSLRPLRR